MKITCQACGAKYSIPDDKVQGRRVKVRCKKCDTSIVVEAKEAEPAPVAVHPPPLPSEEGQEDATTDAWMVNLSDTDQRSMSTEELVEGWRAGSVTEEAFVWREGLPDWKPALEVEELKALLEKEPKPAPAPTRDQMPTAAAVPRPGGVGAAAPAPSPEPALPTAAPEATPAVTASPGDAPGLGASELVAPVVEATKPVEAPPESIPARLSLDKARPSVDLFANTESAGSEEEEMGGFELVPPQMGAAPPFKLTGARNESSVLFSLDALTAGTAAKQEEPPKSERADDLLGLGSMEPLMPTIDPLAAPVPITPEPAPGPTPVAVPAAVGIESEAVPRQGGKGKFIIGGVVLAALAAAAVGVAVTRGNSGEPQPAVSAQTPTKSSAEPKAEKDEPKAEKDEPKEAADAGEAEPKEEKADAGKVSKDDNKKFFEALKKQEGESKEAPKTPKEEPKEEAVSAPPFNTAAARAALASAAGAASGCKKPGGPTGTGKALVTFAPSGRATTANVVGGAFGGTAVGGCVASVFRRARVPAFSGGAVTVGKSFTIPP